MEKPDWQKELDDTDNKANEALNKERDKAREAKIYHCPGPVHTGVFIDIRTQEQKLRDERWKTVKKK